MVRYLAGASLAAMLVAAPAAAEFALTVLHTNDVHSRIEPINKYDSTCAPEDDAEGKCFGGAARLKTAIDARRAATNTPLLVLDAGDQFQGSLIYTTYKGKAAVEMMNAIGYDAMAIGNHEFDDGPEALAAFIELSDAPVLLGNVESDAGAPMDGKGVGPLVLEVGGERIGVIGATATDTDVTSSPGPTIRFRDDIAYLTQAAEALTAQGVNKIIALTHVGLPRDREIAAAVPGLDLIVGGHSHTLLSNSVEGAADVYPIIADGPEGAKVAIAQAYAYGKYLGAFTAMFDDSGALLSASGEPVLLDASVEPNAQIAARVAELVEPIEELKRQRVGETAGVIDGSRDSCRSGECEMGVLVADAMLDRVKGQGIQIALQNGGGLRASIDAGEVTMGEVLTVLPFQNTLSTFTLTGAQIRAALENGVSKVEEGAGRFPQVAGMRFSWDPTAEPGARIMDVEVEGEGGFTPLADTQRYGVVSNNYMRGGGDGYASLTEAQDAYDYGPGLEMVLADYIAAHAPYEPHLAGRIIRAALPTPTLEESAAPVTQATQEAAETATDAAGAAVAGAVAGVKDAAASAADAVGDAVETVGEAAGGAAKAVTGALSDAAETVEQAGEKAAETAGDAAQATQEAASDAATAAGEAASDPATTTMQAGERAAETATDAAADAANAVEQSAQDAAAAAEKAAEGAAETMEQATQPAQPTTEMAGQPAESVRPDPAPQAGAEHVVKQGESLWIIAREQLGDATRWKEIVEMNKLASPTDLSIGQKLRLPAR